MDSPLASYVARRRSAFGIFDQTVSPSFGKNALYGHSIVEAPARRHRRRSVRCRPFAQARPLAEEHDGENRHEHHAQFVDRRDFAASPSLQRAEVAHQRARVASADSLRNTSVFADSSNGFAHLPASHTNNASGTISTMVRISVARSESTFWMPILAKIAVSAANNAESNAQKSQPAVSIFDPDNQRWASTRCAAAESNDAIGA